MKRIRNIGMLIVLIACALFGGGKLLKNTGAPPGTNVEGMRVHFIDVGQADGALIQLPDGRSLLIDAGKNEGGEKMVDYLREQGVTRLDYVVGTHPHEDHIGGLDDVIDAFEIGKVYMPKKQQDTKTFEDVLAAISRKGLKVTTAKAGVTLFDEGDLKAVMVAPVKDDYKETNDFSAVIRLTYGDVSFLFTGDAEEVSERQITADVSADVLKAGHHGSSTSTSDAFFRRVSPRYAVISCGEANSYGHPHHETMQKLNEADVDVYRTDQDGTIVMDTDGTQLEIHTEREG